MRYYVTTSHPHPKWRLNNAEVKVTESRGEFSASLPNFGYVCGFNSPSAAIRDLCQANGAIVLSIIEESSDA